MVSFPLFRCRSEDRFDGPRIAESASHIGVKIAGESLIPGSVSVIDKVVMRTYGELLDHNVTGKAEQSRIRRERITVRAMVAMYCHHYHDGGSGLCRDCSELADYADRKLDRCPYGGEKPACTRCPIHCYRPELRERMREVMRFAGPRMIWRHPYLAIRHLLDERKNAPELPKKGDR